MSATYGLACNLLEDDAQCLNVIKVRVSILISTDANRGDVKFGLHPVNLENLTLCQGKNCASGTVGSCSDGLLIDKP